MAKRKRAMTKAKMERWLKEERGQGVGKDYKPWLQVQDVPSKGRCSRIHGIKTERQHEFFSDLETHYFYIVEFCDCVKDIREQFPLLPIEQTLQIADELGIKHPTDPYSKEPIVMTTDFFLLMEQQQKLKKIARTIKSKDDLHNKRQIEKFEIERRYWEMKEIDWGVVTEQEIDTVMAKNIEITRPYYYLQNYQPFRAMTMNQIENLVAAFKQKLLEDTTAVREIAYEFEEKMMLPSGAALAIYKHLLYTKQLRTDLTKGLNIDIPQENWVDNNDNQEEGKIG